MTPHDHTTIVPGCYRCELGQDEARAQLCKHDGTKTYHAAWRALLCDECGTVIDPETGKGAGEPRE